jgi:hypothetical protein
MRENHSKRSCKNYSLVLVILFISITLVMPVAAVEGKIAFASNRDISGDSGHNSEIYVMNADGSNPTRLTYEEDGDRSPDWSPDGTAIAFGARCVSVNGMSACLKKMDADGTNIEQLGWGITPDWSPDGTQIAYSIQWGAMTFAIGVMNEDGSNPTIITELNDRDPAWSPDGSTIAFWQWGIRVINTDGTGLNQLTENSDVEPAWSPDGTMIAFVSTRDGNQEIYVMKADGSQQTDISNNPADDYHPAWSRDGTTIAFVSERDGNKEIYVMKADGSQQTDISNNPADDFDPSWFGPDYNLAIVSTNPEDGTYGVPADIGEITVTFNEPIYYDPTPSEHVEITYSVGETTFQVPIDSISVRDENTLVINAPLAGYTYYKVHVMRVKGTDGDWIPGLYYDFYFQTASTDPAPTVVSTNPINNAINVPVDVSIAATMSETIGLCDGPVTMVDSQNNPIVLVNPTRGYTSLDYLHIFITPVDSLALGETYTVNIQGLQHQNVAMEEPYILSFTTTSGNPTQDLISTVQSMELSKPVESGLIEKLTNAEALIAQGKYKTAQNVLNAFIKQVNAQTGKTITTSQANELIVAAQQIIDSIFPN